MQVQEQKPGFAERLRKAGGSVYFIGIGGIGMSALARYFHAHGISVHGYDRTATPLTQQLESEGIHIHYQEAVDLIPTDVQLVIFTPAIRTENQELRYMQKQGYTLYKRSDVLQQITNSSLNICVAGTHGKTTISSMTGHLLRHSGFGCNAFLGGIAVNYGSNFWSSYNNVTVVEADEYDRSFLKLHPYIAIITSMDPDHLDIYGTAAAMEEAFIAFSKQVQSEGWLIVKYGLSRIHELRAEQRISYHLSHSDADVHTTSVNVVNGCYEFDVQIKLPGKSAHTITGLRLQAGGLHNVENLLPAITVAYLLGVSDNKIKEAVTAYQGVKRRFEYVLAPGEGSVVLIDDYAHHPEELRALISGVRNLFKGYQLLLVFQPHLFSRTRDLATDFAAQLDTADAVLLLPIYAARELPIPGVESNSILQQMQLGAKALVVKENLLNAIEEQVQQLKNKGKQVVVVTAGAGDIDAFLPALKSILKKI